MSKILTPDRTSSQISQLDDRLVSTFGELADGAIAASGVAQFFVAVNAHCQSEIATLIADRDRLLESIAAVQSEGEILKGRWLEEYTKRKGGKEYTYTRKCWVVGKKAGRSIVDNKHIPRRQVGEVRSQIERGHRVVELEKQVAQAEEAIALIEEKVRVMCAEVKTFVTRTAQEARSAGGVASIGGAS